MEKKRKEDIERQQLMEQLELQIQEYNIKMWRELQELETIRRKRIKQKRLIAGVVGGWRGRRRGRSRPYN